MPSPSLSNDFHFPTPFAKIGSKLPAVLSHTPLMLLLEYARRQQLLIAPETLYGKRFKLVVEDLGLSLFFECDAGKFVRSPMQHYDVMLAANAIDFVKLASGAEDADSLFFRRRLRIEGDTELGIAVKYWIDASERPAWLIKLGAAIC